MDKSRNKNDAFNFYFGSMYVILTKECVWMDMAQYYG